MSKKLFKNLTLSQKTILYFKEQGFEEVESRSKYTVLKSPTWFYFIGKSGAVRINTRNAASDSMSLTDKFKPVVEKWAAERDPQEWIIL